MKITLDIFIYRLLCLTLLMGMGNIFSSCQNTRPNMNDTIDIQGHRGCRGLYPENTIPAFLHAIDLGVHTLELDVVATNAGDVFVSHEPFFNHEIATHPVTGPIDKNKEKSHNMFGMTKDEIQRYDVGLLDHVRFPSQKKMSVHKPTLQEMVTAVEEYIKSNQKDDILYNIEIKREPQNDDVFHPKMEHFADLVVAELRNLKILDRTTVQCFDVETLQYIHNKYPEISLVYLVMDQNGHEKNIENLGFYPAVYSPYFKLVSKGMINFANEHNIRVIPWTVNEEVDMKKMINLNVHGIISDYPDRLIQVVNQYQTEK